MTRREFNATFSIFSSCFFLKDFDAFSASQYLTNQNLIGLEKPFLCGTDYKLIPEVFDAFEEMKKAASADGLRLWCSSGYRSFKSQKQVWNDKYKKIKNDFPSYLSQDIINCLIEYSSIPGTSRHHWGTDLDIVDAFGYENSNPLSHKNYEAGGEYQYLSYWLTENAAKYGFYKVYTNENLRSGFKFEPWHYSYKKLSKLFLNQFLEINILKINGLSTCFGNENFTEDFISEYKQKYILGINPELL